MSFAVVSIWIRHASECFYFCVYMLNDDPFPSKAFVVLFLAVGKPVIFARFEWNLAFGMEFAYAQIAKIRIQRNRIRQHKPKSSSIKPEVMLASATFADINDFFCLAVNEHLCLYGMALLFA